MSVVAQHLLEEIRDGVLHLIIHRPEKRNALTLAMYTGLASGLRKANDNPAVRVILMSGAEDCFTSGNDLGDFLQHPPSAKTSPVFQFLLALTQNEKPLIAAVGGPAIGIGTTLLLHCDLIYAAASTVFQLPFVKLGLVPEAGSSLLLPRRLGHPRAAELLLLGEPFGADEALDYGLINAVCAPEQLLVMAWDKAKRIAAQPPAAVRLTKRLMKKAEAAAIEQAMSLEAEQFVQQLNSPEAKEALRAFLEKREPDFSQFE